MRAIWREYGPGYERRKPGVSGASFSRIYNATKVPSENPPGPRTDRRWFLSALKRIDKRVGFIEPVALESKDADVAARLLERTIVRLQALALQDARPKQPPPAPEAHLRAVGDELRQQRAALAKLLAELELDTAASRDRASKAGRALQARKR
jgi:hypothetical protein